MIKTKLFLSALLMLATNASIAGEAKVTYIDSVQKWGAWELDIEPAAGGLSQPTTQALNARDSKVSFRTNSFSALAPHITQNNAQTSPAPAPVIPPPAAPPPPPAIPTAPGTFAPPGATP